MYQPIPTGRQGPASELANQDRTSWAVRLRPLQLAACLASVLALAACGGGGDSAGTVGAPTKNPSPTAPGKVM